MDADQSDGERQELELDGDDRLCVVCLAAIEGIGPASTRKLLRAAEETERPLSEVLALPPELLSERHGLDRKAARAVSKVRSPLLAGEAILERLWRAGVAAVFPGDPDYPPGLLKFLGAHAPVVIFLGGDADVLKSPSVGIVGSRQPSAGAQREARFLAEELARCGWTVVSGGAVGIDTAAHRSAIACGATAVIPPVGILRFQSAELTQELLPAGRWCVLGQFPPDSPWRTGYALMRNRTIVSLSDCVVAFEPRDHGGTRHSSLTALRMGKPLFVVSASSGSARRRGVERLIRMGAAPLDVENMPDGEGFQRLLSEFEPPRTASQLKLYDWMDREEPGLEE